MSDTPTPAPIVTPASETSVPSPGLVELLTPAGMALLDSLPPYTEDSALTTSTRLRGAGHSAELVAEVLTQSRLRAKAHEKFGPFAQRMLFTSHGLEQATRLQVAAHHAARFRDAGIERIADLGCGLGGDTLAKAALGLEVLGVDSDPVTVALATVNTSVFPQVRIELGRAETTDLHRVDAAWFDPARRESRGGTSRRIHDPELASPPLSTVVQCAKVLARGSEAGVGPVGAKVAPAVNHEVLPAGTETQWVSWNGSLVEACVWFGPLARRTAEDEVMGRSALVLGERPDGTRWARDLTADARPDDELRTPEVGAIGEFIVEPDPAVFRSGLLGLFAQQVGATTVHPDIAYLSVDAWKPSPLGRAFRVREVMPFDVKAVGKHLREMKVGRAEVKKRGMDVDPAQVRRQLKLDAKLPGTATVIATRILDKDGREKRVAIITEAI